MQGRPARKKAVNLSIDVDLLAEAKAAGINLSALTERILRAGLKEARTQRWREENRMALAAYDQHIESDGLWLDEMRTW